MLTAKGQYYVVYLDAVKQSQHVTEREAVERAQDVALDNPGKKVLYRHEYEVAVDMSKLRRVIDDVPPPAPANNQVTVLSLSQIEQFWIGPVDASGIKNYDVYRDGVLVSTTTDSSFLHTGLTAVLHTFKVKARDNANNVSVFSLEVSATPADVTAPTAPTLGLPTLQSPTAVVVPLITPAVDVGGSGLATYTMQRATDAAFTQGVTISAHAPNAFPVTVSGLSQLTTYYFRARGIDGAGNIGSYGASVLITTTGGLAWDADIPEQLLQVNVLADVDLPALMSQPPETIIVTGGGRGTLSVNGALHYVGTPLVEESFSTTFFADDNSDESDYALAELTAQSNGGSGWNFRQYANRAALMAFLQSIDAQCPTGGPKYVHSQVANPADGQYAPVPAGAFAKVDLSSAVYLTGGRSVFTGYFQGEQDDHGPLIEIPILNPGPVNYYRVAFFADPQIYTHNFGGGDGRKILFLDGFSFESGQIVVTLRADFGGYINAYIVSGGARSLYLDHGTGPQFGGQALRRQILTARDTGPKTGPGGATDANNAALWMARWGPSREGPDTAGALPLTDFERVGPYWVGLTVMTDQNYVNPSTGVRGMLKMWQNHKNPSTGIWTPPMLTSILFRDARMQPYPTRSATGWRLVFRAEDMQNAVPANGGLYWDQALRSPVALKHPGGQDLPFPGQQIPPGWPPANTTETN